MISLRKYRAKPLLMLQLFLLIVAGEAAVADDNKEYVQGDLVRFARRVGSTEALDKIDITSMTLIPMLAAVADPKVSDAKRAEIAKAAESLMQSTDGTENHQELLNEGLLLVRDRAGYLLYSRMAARRLTNTTRLMRMIGNSFFDHSLTDEDMRENDGSLADVFLRDAITEDTAISCFMPAATSATLAKTRRVDALRCIGSILAHVPHRSLVDFKSISTVDARELSESCVGQIVDSDNTENGWRLAARIVHQVRGNTWVQPSAGALKGLVTTYQEPGNNPVQRGAAAKVIAVCDTPDEDVPLDLAYECITVRGKFERGHLDLFYGSLRLVLNRGDRSDRERELLEKAANYLARDDDLARDVRKSLKALDRPDD